MELPFEIAAMIEVYVDDALRSTGTQKGTTLLRFEPDPDPTSAPDPDVRTHQVRTYLIDETSGLDYAALFDEPPPEPLPRRRAARGSSPPQHRTETARESFEDDVTAVMVRPSDGAVTSRNSEAPETG